MPDDQFIDDQDLVFSAVAGVTPMFRISDQVFLKFDFMTAVNFGQDTTGMAYHRLLSVQLMV
ncbi:hypothetical protein [Mesohalobacter halotolerans]|uniref:Uncharacterized protein n=1 Tax=Mesohalobacter halotolerans TaxID=1883405 RepID=A0A4U5TPP5_9FLAO|nr:hypothetical protein [Mesohalobacter halotolerans]MBS3737509.1 hypothetical protein [Psychroflexus sp.]TKS55691.1 hypothetical protein FCN74_10325 [Mesohalobacter halotolerans]